MPNVDRSSYYIPSPETLGANSYDKILAIFHKNNDDLTSYGRSKKTQIFIKSGSSYEATLASMPSGLYQKSAGIDLGGLFMPFESKIGDSDLPSFHNTFPISGTLTISGAIGNGYDLLPFRWDSSASGYIYDKIYIPNGDGDSIDNLITGDIYYGDTDRYNKIDNIRGIGFRLPMMGVGWGLTTDGTPFPSGTNSSGEMSFKGGYSNGYQIDSSDYIAAPIDLRYDTSRNVWTAGQTGFWAEIQSVVSGIGDFRHTYVYTWIEKELTESGILVKKANNPRFGASGINPAIEVNNNQTIPSGTNVWIFPRTTRNTYAFEFGGIVTKWIKITGNSAIPNRSYAWQYSFIEQELAQYGQFQDKIGGVTSASGIYAYNTIESNNTNTGIQGNSINVDTIPPTFAFQAVRGSPVVLAFPTNNCSGIVEYLFSYENAIDGECE